MKTIIQTVEKAGTVEFNADYAAEMTLEQFLALNVHQYPNLTDENREKVLKQVHAQALDMAKKDTPAPLAITTTTSTDGNDGSGDASKISSDKSTTGSGAGSSKKSGSTGGLQSDTAS